MKIYRFLSNVKFLQSYSLKLLFIAIVGIHIPLIGLAVFLSSNLASSIDTKGVFLLTFALTFLASALSLFILNEMVIPVKLAKNALRTYLTERKLPRLPVHYQDEVGVLLQSVQKTLESLDELLQEKQDMMALLSHDLRSPISSTISLAEIIKLECNQEGIVHYCDKIIEQSEKQLHLLQAVLHMLRQDQSSLGEIEKQNYLFADLLDAARQSLEIELEQKQMTLIQEVPAGLEVNVEKDTFIQVLINVIHNAIKFSFRNQQIVVSARQIARRTEIEIQDFGIGIQEEEDKSRIFNRFTTLKKRGTEGEPTMGIGLYLCKKIMQSHRGDIYVSSGGLQKGSTFHIILHA